MTGYAYRELQTEQFHATLQVKSCNNRYLDVRVFVPNILNPLETELRSRVSSRVSRGRVDVQINYRSLESEAEIHVDREAVRQYAEAFRTITETAGIDSSLSLDHFLISAGDVLKPLNPEEGTRHQEELLAAFDQMLVSFDEQRLREGEATRQDVASLLSRFAASFSRVKTYADEIEDTLQKNLRQRFEQLVGDNYDENRILSEVAVLLMKYSIHEEIQRIDSHLDQFSNFLEGPGAVGKKIDFLCQELNREVNTIAAKSTIAEVNQAVVEMKDHIENIREQLRNVE